MSKTSNMQKFSEIVATFILAVVQGCDVGIMMN